jgi:hypothetical protein
MTNKKLFGIILIIIGGLFLLDKFNVFNLSVLFSVDGWWTLFLIVPALISMTRQGVTTGNTVLLIIGVVLLLRERGIDFEGFLVPAVLIVLGISLFVRK